MEFFIVLVLIFGVSARDYCNENNACTSDANCTQLIGAKLSAWGYCCNSRCIADFPILRRGQICTSDPCQGVCGGMMSCRNGICTALLGEGCACTANENCTTSLCNGAKPAGQYCLSNVLKNGSPCNLDIQCQSGMCSNDTHVCIGRPLSALCDPKGTDEQCADGLFCPDWNFDPRTGLCLNLSAKGGPCRYDSDCNSTDLACTGTATDTAGLMKTCQSLASLGSPCGTETKCCCGNICNLGKCIQHGAAHNGEACDMDTACGDGYICGDNQPRNGAKGSCVPINSVTVGGNCSSTQQCQLYSQCVQNVTSGFYTCSDTFLGRPCDPFSSVSDTLQCGLFPQLYCACGTRTCMLQPKISNNYNCSKQLAAYNSNNIPNTVDPRTLNYPQQLVYADLYCCQNCPGSFSVASDAGYFVNCQKLTISSVTECQPTAADQPMYQYCDSYHRASAASLQVSVGIILLCSLFSTFLSF